MGCGCHGEEDHKHEEKEGCCGGDWGCEDESRGHAQMMMQLSDNAWAELMKEKMKSHYEKKVGQSMDKVAEIGVDMGLDFWESHMKQEKFSKEKIDEYEKKLKEAFNSGRN